MERKSKMMAFKRVLFTFVMFLTVSYKNVFCEDNEVIINSDCEYYCYSHQAPVGWLKKGQTVLILDYYYPMEREDGNFNIYVEIQTIDSKTIGYVDECNITYPDNDRTAAWWENTLLTREYYYKGNVEEIYQNEYALMMDEGLDKEQSIGMMKHFFSENRLLVSRGYLIIGNSQGSAIYKLAFIERNGQNYTFHLTDYSKEEFRLTLIEDGSTVAIIDFGASNKIYYQNLIEYSLNVKYAKYDDEKSKIVKSNVIRWIQFQLSE
ncbi:MAG: hypothetical protein LBJ31_10490 [Treponema sp.]|jgi:hypothetical protein|nr:hypothetical protein [Treponema sp.]